MTPMDLGPHAGYIWAAYAAVAAGLAALAIWLVLDGRRQQHLVDQLETRGVRRRSGRAHSADK
jgi:heme exporter protein D